MGSIIFVGLSGGKFRRVLFQCRTRIQNDIFIIMLYVLLCSMYYYAVCIIILYILLCCMYYYAVCIIMQYVREGKFKMKKMSHFFSSKAIS